jgi:hypothetical protein
MPNDGQVNKAGPSFSLSKVTIRTDHNGEAGPRIGPLFGPELRREDVALSKWIGQVRAFAFHRRLTILRMLFSAFIDLDP